MMATLVAEFAVCSAPPCGRSLYWETVCFGKQLWAALVFQLGINVHS